MKYQSNAETGAATNMSVWILIAVVFVAGFGWGRWYEEWSAKQEISKRDEHKLTVSMPMKGDDAQAVMSLLKNLIDQVKAEGLIKRDEAAE